MFLGFATKNLALCWFLQVAILVMVAYTMGVLPAICSNIYPAGVRISGFNFAYNFGIMSFGGLVSWRARGRGVAGGGGVHNGGAACCLFQHIPSLRAHQRLQLCVPYAK
jgi:hypothetical protein